MIQSCITFFPLLKHTMKQIILHCKNFISVKNGFVKGQKMVISQIGDVLGKIDKVLECVEKIVDLQAIQSKGNKEQKHRSATPYIKQNTMLSKEQLEMIEKALKQIAKIIQLTITQSTIPQKTSFSLLTFLLQQNIFMTRIRFHIYTFLTKVDLKGLVDLKEETEQVIIQSVKCCQNQWIQFMTVWKMVTEKEHDLKTYEQLNKMTVQYKSYLVRIIAAFYQLIYNVQAPCPSTFTNFILLSNTLITYLLPKPHLSQKQQQKLIDKSDKKSFWRFSRASLSFSLKQNNPSSVSSYDISRSMAKKRNEMDGGSESIEERNCKSKKQTDRRENIVRNAENVQKNEDVQGKQMNEPFLTKDELQVVEFYRNSLIQRMLNLQKEESFQQGFYKQFILDLIKSYHFKSQLTPKAKFSKNDLVEQVLMKIIYKDENLKHINQSQQSNEQPHPLPYQKLLTRSNSFLQLLHLFLSTSHLPSSASLLDFIMNLYEKITIAHKIFVDNEMVNRIEFDGKNSFSQKASVVESISSQTQNNFQILYRINVTTICILVKLYDLPALGSDHSEKLVSFNTLLTLHQVFFNQINFPNNFSVFQITNNDKSKSPNSYSTPCYQEYIKSLSSLNTLLIKAHEGIYKSLDSEMIRQNQSPKSTQKMVKVDSLSSRQKKSQEYEELEEFILSYQNIIIQSLDQISNEFEDSFFNYYEKSKQYLSSNERFTYFKQISQNIFNYISCLMMIIYRKNHGHNEGKNDCILLKNNVMTSLKLIKVLEKILVLLWGEFWEMEKWNHNEGNLEKNQMFLYVTELIGNLLKLLHKFSTPKGNQSLDYRYLKSALVMAPLIQCYESKVQQISKNHQYFPILIKSKSFLKILFQITQNLSLPSIKAETSSNLQTRTKINEHVFQKMIGIFSLEPKKLLHPTIVNHHFSLLVEVLFDNFSRIKEKLEDHEMEGIGKQKFTFRLVGKVFKQLNEAFLVSGGVEMPCRLEEKQLEKITVILEMYLTDQNYNIDIEITEETVAIFEEINEIQIAAKKVFCEMVNFLIFQTLLSGGKYQRVIKMIEESKFLATEYLAYFKDNIIKVKQLALDEEKSKKLSLKGYIKLSIDVYFKIMKIFLLDHDKNDESQHITDTILTASNIFHQLLQFPHLISNIELHELLSLEKIKSSLSSNRVFNTFQLETTIVEYVCFRKENIKENFETFVSTLGHVFEEITFLASRQVASDQVNFWHVSKMLANIKDSKFISNLFTIFAEAKKHQLQSDQLNPSKLIQLINSSFITFSQSFMSTPQTHHKTISTMKNLVVLETPTFKLHQPQFGSKKDVKGEKRERKQSNFGIQLTQEVDQDEFDTPKDLPRGGFQSNEKEEKEDWEEDSNDEDEQDDDENRELIVSELEIPGENEQMKDKNDFIGSTGEIYYDQTDSMADESYFGCSKLSAIKLYQSFYLNLFRQLEENQVIINKNSHLKTQFNMIAKDLKEMLTKIGEFHSSAMNNFNKNDTEKIEIIKCHFRIMEAICSLNIWTQLEINGTIQQKWKKIAQQYFNKLSPSLDSELSQSLAQYVQEPANQEQQQIISQPVVDQQNEPQTPDESLINKLEKMHHCLKSNQDIAECHQAFQSIKDELINFMLAEYQTEMQQPSRHVRKMSFYPEPIHHQDNLVQLFGVISLILSLLTEQDIPSKQKIQLYQLMYSDLENVFIECMDLPQITKTIKSIFKQHHNFTINIKL